MPEMDTRSKEKLSFDVIVVGAGLAGGTAAIMAARAGLSVALIERGQAPVARTILAAPFTRTPWKRSSLTFGAARHPSSDRQPKPATGSSQKQG